jgi:hypothetical protein
LNQIYGWVDMKITIKSVWDGCTFSASICNIGLSFGIRAPKLLTSPMNIPLPTFVTNMFPICAVVDQIAPSAGKITAESGRPSALALGTSMILKDGVPTVTASATLSAASNVFPDNAEVHQLTLPASQSPLELNICIF